MAECSHSNDGIHSPGDGGTTQATENTHGADPVLLAQMLEMGVSRNLAIRSLLHSGNNSIEAAFTWSSELSAEEMEALCLKPLEDDAHEWEDMDDDSSRRRNYPKMVMVVNSQLNMKPGKIAAQVAHATLDLYRKIKSRSTPKSRQSLSIWSNIGETIVVVKGSNTEHLRELRAEAESHRIPCHIVSDAGRTQVAAGSETVLALFGESDEVDKITGKLKLL